jgi:ribonuclease E
VPPQASPEPAADASKPQVVTRTRRRSASRPAGPPSPESGTVDGQHPVGGAASAGQVGEPPVTGTVEPGTAESDPAPAVEHVPIKKKGARKR